jgi:hypothetical protein
MRIVARVGALLTICCSSIFAAPFISSDEAELMRIEALTDTAPDRIHGPSDYILDGEETFADATTGNNPREPDN